MVVVSSASLNRTESPESSELPWIGHSLVTLHFLSHVKFVVVLQWSFVYQLRYD